MGLIVESHSISLSINIFSPHGQTSNSLNTVLVTGRASCKWKSESSASYCLCVYLVVSGSWKSS